MRIAFIGTVAFSRRCLTEVLAADGEVVGVFTMRAEDATFNADYADLEPIAREHGIPVRHVDRMSDPDAVEALRALHPDVVFVFGWSELLSREVLEAAPLGCIGTHPALLPAGRGRHPIVWTLVEGLDHSGLTFFYLDEGADSGDIAWQGEVEVEVEDDAASLYAKIEDLAARGIRELLPQLESGTAPRIPQDESRATYWRRRGDDDRCIDWSAPSVAVYNLIRGLARPYVGATTTANGRELVVWRARLRANGTPPPEAVPGTVLARREDRIEVRTGDSSIELLEVEPDDSALLSPGSVLGGRP